MRIKGLFWVFFVLIAIGAVSRGFPNNGDGEEAALASNSSDGSNPWSVNAPDVAASNKVAVAKPAPKIGGSQDLSPGGDVTLKRRADGHFYANIRVDAQPVDVLVDTGASIIALTGSDALSLGLDWNPAQVRPIGRGASGDVYGVPVTLRQVELGGIAARNVQAVIIPEGLDVTLLGQSFLREVDTVQIQGNTMVLSD